MRDSIVRALDWVLRLLLSSRGRHSAAFLADQPEPADQPAPEPEPACIWRTPWRGPSAETVRDIFSARPELPYLQRERWRAAAFAEMGIDYDHPTTNITPVRAVAA
ncbi:hypothetical protein ABT039_34840 [Streptomyces lasiicapitis]|uniref:hypothetical protein n=1 Tax=Streptomyces lasiicapitis TaxID=1923961 RepID=UPI0033200D9B